MQKRIGVIYGVCLWKIRGSLEEGENGPFPISRQLDVCGLHRAEINFLGRLKTRKSLCGGIRIHTLKSFVHTFGYKNNNFENKKYFL